MLYLLCRHLGIHSILVSNQNPPRTPRMRSTHPNKPNHKEMLQLKHRAHCFKLYGLRILSSIWVGHISIELTTVINLTNENKEQYYKKSARAEVIVLKQMYS